MQIGIVSDTHDNLDHVDAAVELFERLDVDVVVHCGDVIAPFSATRFDGDFDFYAVRGNNDGEWALQDAIDEFGTYLGELGELTLEDNEFAVYHGTNGPIVDALVECGNYDYVFHGHTHERVMEEHEGTVRINPGGIAIPQAPDPPEVAIVDLETSDIVFHELGDVTRGATAQN